MINDPAENPTISLCVVNYGGADGLEGTLTALGRTAGRAPGG